jgi:flagellin-like hook-associated protein FlgL
MTGIVLSASVRQNLLSLQSTASLLATTQNDLSTGNKVNSALDNPTSFFTAQSLNNRASDIGNLLDSIGNGVQVLQAANTGITSLQSLVASAQSIANQVLQTPIGYSAKSSVTTTAITGATATNLLGTTAADATFTGAAEVDNQSLVGVGTGTAVTGSQLSAFANTAATAGAQLFSASGVDATGATLLSGLTTSTGVAQGIAANDTLTVNGKIITFGTGAGALTSTGANAYTLGIGTTLDDLVSAIDTLQGNTGTGAVASTDTGGILQLNTGVAADLSVTAGAAGVLTALGLSASAANTATRGGNAAVSPAPAITTSTALTGTAVAGGPAVLGTAFAITDQLTVNGKTISFHTGSGNTGTIAGNNFSIGLTGGTIGDVLTAVDQITGGTSSIDATGKISLTTNTTTAISLTGSAASTLTALGLTTVAASTITVPAAAAVISGTTTLSGAASPTSTSLATGFADGDTLTVDGKILTFSSTNPTSTPSADGGTISTTGTVQNLLDAIDAITGSTGANVATVSAKGAITLHTGTGSALSITSSNAGALAALGFGTGVTQADSTLTNQTLTIAATGNGTATNITFGTGVGQIATLNDLNTALAANNLQATIDSTGAITVTTSNNAASTTIGKIGGTATPFSGLSALGPVVDPNAQATRSGLVTQFNNTLKQIDTTAQDSSFNGVNLLQGDTLNLTFDETGKSTLAIAGVTFNTAGLGLSTLTAGTDFLDSNSANAVLGSLNAASTTLRSEASNLGSNLSIVQTRQDFSKNLINVLQTGASNLTLADTNEEAANSQALSTRQSIAVSALALANQSQQSVLQLLR